MSSPPKPSPSSIPCGSLVAVPTPFRNGALDEAALGLMCERQIRRGSSGLVVCGSTGEAPALSLSEHARALAVAVEAAAGRAAVIAGCGAPATGVAVTLAREAGRAGADAILCSAPPYSRPTQDGIIAHVSAVARACGLPAVLYDVPARTGIAIADGTIARLFEAGLIEAVKDACGDLARPGRLRALCGRALVQLTGEDATAPAYRAMGGHGCISVAANVAPALCARLHASWDHGDLEGFARARDLLAPLAEALFLESSPIPVKAALARLGLCSSEMRLPLLPAGAATLNRIEALSGVFAAEAGEAPDEFAIRFAEERQAPDRDERLRRLPAIVRRRMKAGAIHA